MHFMILFIQRECPYKGIRYREIPLYPQKKSSTFLSNHHASYLIMNVTVLYNLYTMP